MSQHDEQPLYNANRDNPSAHRGEIRVTDPKTGGQKGQKLAELGAVDPNSIMEVARVAGFGARKYARYNFAKGYKWSLSYDALQRHLHAFWAGEERDEESGLYHLAHAGWHILTLLTFCMRGRGTDDRMHHMVVKPGTVDTGEPSVSQVEHFRSGGILGSLTQGQQGIPGSPYDLNQAVPKKLAGRRSF